MSWGPSTAANVDIVALNTVTCQEAFQFGISTDTWTLVGQSFIMEIKADRADAAAIVSFSSATGSIVVDDTTNRIIHLLVPEATFTANLPVGEYVYDLVMYDGSTPPIRVALMYGKFCVTQGVTES